MARPSPARAAPIRRFIYLLIADGDSVPAPAAIGALHKIDTKPLFEATVCPHPRRSAAAAAARWPSLLPRPVAHFDCAHGHQFLPLGRGVRRIVGVDRSRHTIIYDTRTGAVRAGPDVAHVKWYGAAWAEAGGRLYHLGGGRGRGDEAERTPLGFEALAYDRGREDWLWTLLPSPPFDSISPFADGGGASGGGGEVVIRVTQAYGGGTFAFDAARGLWLLEGTWTLPFSGRAQFVADYGLWFGFAGGEDMEDLCAADLTAAGPARGHVWLDVDGLEDHLEERWRSTYLSYLGCGRFCITRFFRMRDQEMVMVTAVEETGAAGAGELHMVRRAARCYYHSSLSTYRCCAY